MNLTLKKSEIKSRIIFLKCLELSGQRDWLKFPLTLPSPLRSEGKRYKPVRWFTE